MYREGFTQHLFSALVLSLLILNPLWADDTEIFFKSSDSLTQPNLLFVLDGSGSMGWYDCADNSVSDSGPCPDDDSPNANTTRLQRMINGLTTILDDDHVNGINIGLMRFSHEFAGGRVIYPLSDIDLEFCNGVPCNESTSFNSQSSVSSIEDNAYEDENGLVVMDTQALPVTLYDGDQQSRITGIRFPDLRIPQGATIEDARIDFTSLTASNQSTISFRVEDTANSEPFEAVADNISNRNWWSNQIDWASQPWPAGAPVESNNLQSLVQRVVQKTNWCGGNALGISVTGDNADFLAAGYDPGSNQGPVLRVTYRLDNVPQDGGCTTRSIVASLDANTADAVEDLRTGFLGTVYQTSTYQLVDDRWFSGFLFEDVDIPKGSTIQDARIKLQVSEQPGINSGNHNIEIRHEDSVAPANFSNTNSNLSNRLKTSAVLWDDVPVTLRETVLSENFAPLAEGIVNKTTWNSGNKISVFLNRHSSSDANSIRGFTSRSFNHFNGFHEAKLEVTYLTNITGAGQLVSGPVTNVKTLIKDQLNDMVPDGFTPTVGALYEAQRYFGGQGVDYGKFRCNPDSERCADYDWVGSASRVSHPDSYTGGTPIRHPWCQENALNGFYCAKETITGSPTYISPIQHECQKNHVVILTDGQPTADTDAAGKAGSLAVIDDVPIGGAANCATAIDGGECGVELAKHMFQADYSTQPGLQNIVTHTIGFNFNVDWLKDVAAAGGGKYYTADSTTELVAAVSRIATEVEKTNTTFVAPGATIDAFSRLSHRKDVYLALFQPSLQPGWKGNLKKYEIKSGTGEDTTPALFGVDPDLPVIDPATGTFKDEAKSFWATGDAEPDGNNPLLGGAAHKLDDPVNRNLVTYFWPDKDLSSNGNKINATNITQAHLGAINDEERLKIIDWVRGIDVNDEDGDNNTTENRNHMGDPLHSRPVLVTYGGTEEDPDSVVFVGTNEGTLHAISTRTGDEIFGFVPNELLANLRTLYLDAPLTVNAKRVYGIDGDMTLRIKDNNNNGLVEADDGDQAILHVGLRRGGRFYFAIDVSNKTSPQFHTNHIGGTGTAPELGETWSKQISAKIKVGNELKDVLIFAGGYDPAQDEKDIRDPDTPDTMGRAIYIIDADNPSITYWAGSINPAGGAEVFSEMLYSFPSDINVVTEGEDRLAAQLYVGDMGGRLWRFDINNGSSSGADLVDGGIIADLSTDDDLVNNRRFYYPPDLSLSRYKGQKTINIAIGSGYQAHPLNTAVSDKFFMIRYPFANSGNYGMQDEGATTYRPIELGDLFDTTNNVIGQGEEADRTIAEEQLAGKQGWRITMEDSGEKILGSSSTLNGVIRFTSYIPGFTSVNCGPDIGRGRFWAVNLEDGTPDSDSIAKGIDNPTKENRYEDLPSGGIPPPVQTLFVEDDNTVTPAVTSGANVLWEGDGEDLTRRWYWAEQPD